MGYIIAIVLLIVIVPLLFMLLSRRTSSPGGVAEGHRSRGVTTAEPAAEQITPRADSTNRATPEAERKLPPG
jgi:hypothetical protein